MEIILIIGACVLLLAFMIATTIFFPRTSFAILYTFITLGFFNPAKYPLGISQYITMPISLIYMGLCIVVLILAIFLDRDHIDKEIFWFQRDDK